MVSDWRCRMVLLPHNALSRCNHVLWRTCHTGCCCNSWMGVIVLRLESYTLLAMISDTASGLAMMRHFLRLESYTLLATIVTTLTIAVMKSRITFSRVKDVAVLWLSRQQEQMGKTLRIFPQEWCVMHTYPSHLVTGPGGSHCPLPRHGNLCIYLPNGSNVPKPVVEDLIISNGSVALPRSSIQAMFEVIDDCLCFYSENSHCFGSQFRL